MCGIAAIFTNKKMYAHRLERMLGEIEHRGPDSDGYHYDKCSNTEYGLAHKRLSIIDLSENGAQPYRIGNYEIIFNGEIYNYKELRQELETLGEEFISQTDTEVLLKSYIRWGIDSLDRFNGMFSFVLVDKNKHRAYGVRDRYGIKPFYYWKQDGELRIASEIKQFKVLDDFRRVLNKDVAANYIINRHLDYSSDTFFHGIRQLEGGEYLELDMHSMDMKLRQWYDLRSKIESDRDVRAEDIRELLHDSVRMRMRSDVEVGVCLSGGIDSSSITCLSDMVKDDRGMLLKSITSSFEDERYDERKWVKHIEDAIDIDSYKIFPSASEFLDDLDDLLYHQDEPFWSTSIYAQSEVFRKAGDLGIKVMLDGQGADEIFGGYIGLFYPFYIQNLIANRDTALLGEMLKGEKKLYVLMQVINKVLGRGQTEAKLSEGCDIFNIKVDLNPKKEFSSSKEQSLYFVKYHLPALLHYEDRSSMRYSIESRVPFLDYRVVEAAFNLRDEQKVGYGIGKKVLRDSMRGIVPDAILDRRDKLGFVTPQAEWIKEKKDIYMKELRDAEGYGFYTDKYLKKKKDELAANSYDQGEIQRNFIFLRWMKNNKITDMK